MTQGAFDSKLKWAKQDLEDFILFAQSLGPLFCSDPNLDKDVIKVYEFFEQSDPEFFLEQWPYIKDLDELGYEEFKLASQQICGSNAHIDVKLVDEFRRLFVGPGHVCASPFGSVYTDHEGVLFGESCLEYRSFLRACGLSLSLKDAIPEDHIGFMLITAAHLAQKDRSLELRDLLEQHLLPWAYHYLEMLYKEAQHPFYQALAQISRLSLRGVQKRHNLEPLKRELFR